MLSNEKPLTPEQLEEEYPGYAESLRWQILQQTVAEAIDLKVSADELEQEARRMVGAQYAQYGMPMDEETLGNVAKTCSTTKTSAAALPTCWWNARSWTT